MCVQCRFGITAIVPPTVNCESDWPVALSPANGTRAVVSNGGRFSAESGEVAPSPPDRVRAFGGQSGVAVTSLLAVDDGDVAPPKMRLVLALARCTDTRAVPVNTAFARTMRTSASASSRCSEAPGTYAPTVPMESPSPRLRELLPRRNESA